MKTKNFEIVSPVREFFYNDFERNVHSATRECYLGDALANAHSTKALGIMYNASRVYTLDGCHIQDHKFCLLFGTEMLWERMATVDPSGLKRLTADGITAKTFVYNDYKSISMVANTRYVVLPENYYKIMEEVPFDAEQADAADLTDNVFELVLKGGKTHKLDFCQNLKQYAEEFLKREDAIGIAVRKVYFFKSGAYMVDEETLWVLEDFMSPSTHDSKREIIFTNRSTFKKWAV